MFSQESPHRVIQSSRCQAAPAHQDTFRSLHCSVCPRQALFLCPTHDPQQTPTNTAENGSHVAHALPHPRRPRRTAAVAAARPRLLCITPYRPSYLAQARHSPRAIQASSTLLDLARINSHGGGVGRELALGRRVGGREDEGVLIGPHAHRTLQIPAPNLQSRIAQK